MSKTNVLYTFIAGASIRENIPFPVNCNCGGVITIMPPMQEDKVVCPKCEAIIKMLVIEGDPGYVIGKDSKGAPTLLPVQGSESKPISMHTQAERDEILIKVKGLNNE